jgi:tetratricopeptide (TPR) repeat protein
MVALLLAGARTQPVVLAFEDLHWADPTSLDLIRALAERGAQAPLLVVATTRPEFRAPWGMRSHHAVVALAPLDWNEVRRMVGDIAAQHALPQDVVERVSERTGGVPLFVEEVTRLLVERGEQGGVQAIPPTLQQSLAARLDRLGPAREVAQIGAVLGRNFVYAMLRDVAEIDEPALQASLDRLADADLLFVEGSAPQANYRFNHALIQDAAYDSLLKSRRQVLHRRAAEILRDQPERLAAQPEAIAHHFTEAGLDDLAIEWWGKAGDQALRRSAFQEAIAHLGKAIEMADKAAGGKAPDESGERRQLHVAYGNALIAARGYGAPETTAAFAKARESTADDKHTPARLAADYGLWVGSYVRGELSSMKTHVTAFLSDVEAHPDSPEACVAYRAAGTTHWFAGEYRQARDHFERALALFVPGRDDDLAFRFGQDAGVSAMLNLAFTLWPLGEVARAVSLVEGAQERLAGVTHAGTLGFGGQQSALFEMMRHDRTRLAQNTHSLVRLAREHDLIMFKAFAVFLEGLVKEDGASATGLADMRRGVKLLRELNVVFFDGLLKIALAEAEARAGNSDRAVAVLDDALATSDSAGYRTFEAELHRVRGELLLQRRPVNPAQAEEAFKSAIAVSREQGTRSFELRTALSLAKLYQSTARPVDAHAVLAPALEGFSPTPEMPEIREAQALLVALAETEEVKAEAARRERRAKLQLGMATALFQNRGMQAAETRAAFEHVSVTAAETADPMEWLAILYGRWAGELARGDVRRMLEVAASMEPVAARELGGQGAIVARRILGLSQYYAGDLAGADENMQWAIDHYDFDRDRALAVQFAHDPAVAARYYLAYAKWMLGDIDAASRVVAEAKSLAERVDHPPTTVALYMIVAMLDCIRNDHRRARANAEKALALARDSNLALWRLLAEFPLSWATTASDGTRGAWDAAEASLASCGRRVRPSWRVWELISLQDSPT